MLALSPSSKVVAYVHRELLAACKHAEERHGGRLMPLVQTAVLVSGLPEENILNGVYHRRSTSCSTRGSVLGEHRVPGRSRSSLLRVVQNLTYAKMGLMKEQNTIENAALHDGEDGPNQGVDRMRSIRTDVVECTDQGQHPQCFRGVTTTGRAASSAACTSAAGSTYECLASCS